MKKFIFFLIIIISIFISCRSEYISTVPCYNMEEYGKYYYVTHSSNYYIDNKRIIKEKRIYRRHINKQRKRLFIIDQKNWKK